jgi:hypothetical protein
MLKDVIENDKDMTDGLRKIGCKTRIKFRNKSAAK